MGFSSPHKSNLNESTMLLGGVSRVRLTICSPERDVRSNFVRSSSVKWQSNGFVSKAAMWAAKHRRNERVKKKSK